MALCSATVRRWWLKACCTVYEGAKVVEEVTDVAAVGADVDVDVDADAVGVGVGIDIGMVTGMGMRGGSVGRHRAPRDCHGRPRKPKALAWQRVRRKRDTLFGRQYTQRRGKRRAQRPVGCSFKVKIVTRGIQRRQFYLGGNG